MNRDLHRLPELRTTDLRLAQQRVGQLHLGVVRHVKVLARLGQGDVQLFLETGRGGTREEEEAGEGGRGGREEMKVWMKSSDRLDI